MEAINRSDLLTLANNYPFHLWEEAMSKIAFSEHRYSRRRISRTENLEIVLYCFKDNQSTDLHDHGGSECVVRCLEGRVNETIYESGEHGLFPVESRVIFRGDIKAVKPEQMHQITNLIPEGSAILKFYSPPLPETDDSWMEESLQSLTEWY